MKKNVLMLVVGLAVGFAAGWLLERATGTLPLSEALRRQKSTSDSEIERLEKQLRSDYNKLLAKAEAEQAQLKMEIGGKEAQISMLKGENEKLTQDLDSCGKRHPEPGKEAGAGEVTQAPLPGDAQGEDDAQEPEPEFPSTQDIKKIIEIRKRITPIGGPLNKLAIKELDLDENQVASINDVLEEEGTRMMARLAEWAGEIVEDKTAEDFEGKSGLEISVAIMPCIRADMEHLSKLSAKDQRATALGRKHFVHFLPRDANLVRIVRTLHEERRKTYSKLGAFLTEEQERVMKKKYLQSGTFIFPGGASYGVGELKPEDLEE